MHGRIEDEDAQAPVLINVDTQEGLRGEEEIIEKGGMMMWIVRDWVEDIEKQTREWR